jgi:putative tryptophan/tyrosine transport system substrate-binding protein
MKRRALLAFGAATSLLGTRFALAGPAAGVRRIDILLSEGSCEESQKFAEDRFQELAKLGYVRGRNLIVEWHCFAGDFARGARIAEQIVRRGTDVLFTIGTPATRMLHDATKTIPIVTWVADPIASGFTKSLARPDGNITGFSEWHPGTPAKEVELIRRVAPRTRRLVIIGDVSYPDQREILAPYEAAAAAAGLAPEMKLVDPSELSRVFIEMKGSQSPFALISSGIAARGDKGAIAKLALRHGVATMLVNDTGFVEVGGLMSFDTDHGNRSRREVAIFDKLLRGIKPADIPWELPDRSHFAINLATAKLLGLTVPTDLLLRADQIVN